MVCASLVTGIINDISVKLSLISVSCSGGDVVYSYLYFNSGGHFV